MDDYRDTCRHVLREDPEVLCGHRVTDHEAFYRGPVLVTYCAKCHDHHQFRTLADVRDDG